MCQEKEYEKLRKILIDEEEENKIKKSIEILSSVSKKDMKTLEKF